MKQSPEYWAWIKAEALAIKSDGCTHALELARQCCWEHDLSFHYGRDPRHAFLIWTHTHEYPWDVADTISFVETNKRFAGCLPWYLKYRFLAVMTAGFPLWKKARERRP